MRIIAYQGQNDYLKFNGYCDDIDIYYTHSHLVANKLGRFQTLDKNKLIDRYREG